MLLNYLKIFFISMVPLIELRGAMPVSQFLKMPVIPSYIVCIIGNMLPVPFIYLFARKVLEWGKDKPVIGTFVALLLFVGIPLPGTGAWTGTLAASILDMDFKSTVAAVMLGVLLAGVIMMTAGYIGFSFV